MSILVIAALVFSIVALVESQAKNWTAWATLLLSIHFFWRY